MQLKLIAILAFVLTIFLFQSCKSTDPIVDHIKLSKGDKIASINRSGCFGRCPVYDMTIYEGGFVEINRLRFMESEGWYKRRLSMDSLQMLTTAFDEAKFMDLQDEYVSYLADLPYINISYINDGIEKTVRGKETLPTSVLRIKDLMHSIATSGQWKSFVPQLVENNDSIKEEPEIVYILEEIIIKPKEGVRLPIWFKDKKDLGIRLNRRIDEKLNLWLITYSQDRYSPQEMLEMLKNDPDIEYAEFNVKSN